MAYVPTNFASRKSIDSSRGRTRNPKLTKQSRYLYTRVISKDLEIYLEPGLTDENDTRADITLSKLPHYANVVDTGHPMGERNVHWGPIPGWGERLMVKSRSSRTGFVAWKSCRLKLIFILASTQSSGRKIEVDLYQAVVVREGVVKGTTSFYKD
ncbi:hypothetical protein TNCV_4543861 [Trichonephila clavipes]|nr:hypothetical protein TNCV_4543861 [Trichonephila clavipes]